MPSNLTRRDFFLYGGATIAGITLGEVGRRQLARTRDRANAWDATEPERWATSVCRACPAACGVRVRLVNDVPVKLEGNPLCPVSRGRLCAKGQAAIEAYFDPDRLTGPARRAQGAGEGQWEPMEWDAAVALLGSHLQPGTATSGDLLAIAAEEHGPVAAAWTRFWTSAGARLLSVPAPTAPRLRSAFQSLTGVDADPHFDLEGATYVLSFGAPIVEDWLSPVWTQRSFGRFRRGSPQTRGRLVQIDARRSMTARKADEWFGVPAERQIILAYGLAAVLLREGRTMTGASRGNISDLEQAVVAGYGAGQVAAATGVPVITVLRLARDLVSSPRPLVVVATDADPALVEAVMALNALIGSFDRPGGIFAAPQPALGSEAEQRPVTVPTDVPSARLVALRDASALRSLSMPVSLFETIERAEFVVSFSPYFDEAAQAADLLMPVHTPLESWHAVVPPAAARGEQVALSRPATDARLKTRDLGELLSVVATTVGGSVATACDWESSQDLVDVEIARLGHERRGTPYATQYQTEWIDQLERGGWWIPAATSPEEFATTVLESGGWLDPALEPGRVLNSLEAQGGPRFSLPTTILPVDEEEELLPPGEYPLRAMAFTPAVVDLLGSLNQPALFELLGQPDGRSWQPWAEMNPETAQALGVLPGTRVRIASPYGVIEVIAVLTEGIRADAVALSHVPVVRNGGRWARTSQVDVRRLWPRGRSAIGTVPVRATRV